MQKWHDAGKRIVVYSSGSVAAQHLLLQHTTESGNNGDLRHFISGWYDTVNAGMKNQQTSYERIVTEENDQAANIKPEEWVFFSDNIKELEPARLAGLQVVLADRPGNAEVDDIEKVKYVVAERFDTLDI
jgi:enolase-phosphatase E1